MRGIPLRSSTWPGIVRVYQIGQIPEILYKTIISTEDPNFYTHKGIDPAFIGYAILQNVQRGKIAAGAVPSPCSCRGIYF